MRSELTPRAHFQDNRIPQLMQPWCKMKHNWKFSVSCSVLYMFDRYVLHLFVVSPFSLSLALWFGGIHKLLFRTLFFINYQHWLSLATCYFSWQSPKLLLVTLVFCDLLVLLEIHVLWNVKKKRPKTKCLTGCSFWISCSLFRLFASALWPRRPVCRSLCRCRSFGRPPTTESSVRGLTASASPALQKIPCLFGKSYRDNFDCSPYMDFSNFGKRQEDDLNVLLWAHCFQHLCLMFFFVYTL